MIVAFVTIAHVNIVSNREVLSDLFYVNLEVLAGDEGGEDGWSEGKITNTHYENGQPVWQRIEIICVKGGPMSSCTESCQSRLHYNDEWHEWSDC